VSLFSDNFLNITPSKRYTSHFGFAFPFQNFAFNLATDEPDIKQTIWTRILLETELSSFLIK